MKLVFVDVLDAPWRGPGIGYNKVMYDAFKLSWRADEIVEVEQWVQEQEQRVADGQIPVFLLINSKLTLQAMRFCRAKGKPFILVDHPHASERRINARSDDWQQERHKMLRIALNSIYSPYKAGAPIWPGRVYPWNLQKWRLHQPKVIVQCPSAADLYGRWLMRSQILGVAKFRTIVTSYQRRGLLIDHEVVVRTRGMAWKGLPPGQMPNVQQMLEGSAAVADGNSGILFDALRFGVPAFVWEHLDKPLANTLASYAPLTIDAIENPRRWQIEREPLFAQLAMTQCTLEELADPVMFRKLIAWQLENLL